MPTGLVATAESSTRIALTWTGSTDNVGVTEYRVYRNGGLVGTAAAPGFTDTGLVASTGVQLSGDGHPCGAQRVGAIGAGGGDDVGAGGGGCGRGVHPDAGRGERDDGARQFGQREPRDAGERADVDAGGRVRGVAFTGAMTRSRCRRRRR